MSKILPINLDVPIKTYSYYAYSHIIISAEERIGRVAAKFKISDFEKEQWVIDKRCLIIDENESGKFQFISDNPYSQYLNGAIYRTIKQDDHIHIQIDYQQYSHPWGDINLFITDLEKDEIGHKTEQYVCRLGHFNREGECYFYSQGEMQSFKIDPDDFFPHSFELILYRKGDYIEVYGGKTGKNLIRLCNKKITFPDNKTFKVGVQVMLTDNVYYKWLYSNHLQISCDIYNEHRRIEFFYGVLKDWQLSTVNYFLNYNAIDIDLVIKWGVIKFIKKYIDEEKYIELMLDQYFVENRNEYKQSHFYHQNLIYGYNDAKKEVLLIGYNEFGILVKTKICYKDLIKTVLKKGTLSSVCIIEYQQDGYAFEWNSDYIKEMIQQYLDGKNSSFYLNHLIARDNRVYGINVYDEFLSDKGMEVLLEDIRISHLLYEHKLCMKERIEFLLFRENITKEETESLIPQMDWIVRTTYNLRNLTAKYNITGEEQIIESIKNKLNEIKEKEENCLRELISYL